MQQQELAGARQARAQATQAIGEGLGSLGAFTAFGGFGKEGLNLFPG